MLTFRKGPSPQEEPFTTLHIGLLVIQDTHATGAGLITHSPEVQFDSLRQTGCRLRSERRRRPVLTV